MADETAHANQIPTTVMQDSRRTCFAGELLHPSGDTKVKKNRHGFHSHAGIHSPVQRQPHTATLVGTNWECILDPSVFRFSGILLF